MNSRDSTPNTSSGFIYFSTPNCSKNDTSDFLAFSEEQHVSPQAIRFNPNHYSSPQSKFHRGSPRNYPNNRRFHRRSGGNKLSNSSYSSYNNSSLNQDGECERGIGRFFHPSFLEDPWAQLEAKLQQQAPANT